MPWPKLIHTIRTVCVLYALLPAAWNAYSQSTTSLRGTVADGDPCAISYDCLNGDSICEPTILVCVASAGGDK